MKKNNNDLEVKQYESEVTHNVSQKIDQSNEIIKNEHQKDVVLFENRMPILIKKTKGYDD